MLWLLVLGASGCLAELFLLDHLEPVWQLVPVTLLALAIPATIWMVRGADDQAWNLFRALMALLVISGLTGVVLHVQGNAEFELELTPGLKGIQLFGAAIRGGVPALAPGVMIQLGLLGLLASLGMPGQPAGADPTAGARETTDPAEDAA